MSHLLKNDKKIYFKCFKITLISFILIFTYFGFSNYIGNKILYLSFSIICNFLIFFAFRRNAIFFETYFSIFLWLGFWFKFTYTLVISDGVFRGDGTGLFDYSVNSFNESLVVSQIGILAFILAGFFREYFIFKYPIKINLIVFKKNLFSFGRKNIWILFIIFFLVTSLINFYFKIYQKGLIPIYEINFLISGTFKWLLLFGLSAFSATLIFLEFNFFKKFFLISTIIILFETFATSSSMISRGMFFNAFALLYGIYKFSNKVNNPNNFDYYLKSFLLIVILFYISVSSVNFIRANYFYIGKSVEFVNKKTINDLQNKDSNVKFSSASQLNSEILFLIANRWVGIDAVMAVVAKKNILNIPFFISSFNERPSLDSNTFYETNFELIENKISDKLYKNVKGNTLPGIIAFLYYSGSLYILFFSIFLISIISALLEIFAFKLSSQNLIFSSLIGQVIAFRFTHFGYLPHQSYLLFGSIILTVIFLYILSFYLRKE